MGYKHFFLVCAILAWFCFADLRAQNGIVQIPRTRFTCQGRPSGYYADMETGCQVYHMCDGLGRQFSYTCPNTTLFQQRMLICDHWYMVNCSTSESDYDANLLIGQRDKPFVSDEEMRLRTPRPDILSVPPNSNYYDGLREAESKFPILPGNSIVGNTETISGGNNNGLDSDKQNYRPPSSWSTGTSVNNQFNNNRPTNSRPANNGKTRPSSNNQNSFINNQNVPPHQNFINNNQHKPFNPNSDNQLTIKDNLDSAASQEPSPTIAPTPNNNFDFTQNTGLPKVTPTSPSLELRPPAAPTTTTEVVYDIDIRMKEPEDDPIYQFIKRFDPNSPDSIKTSMTKTEILNINQQLPDGQSSGEDQRTPRKNKNTGNRFNSLSSETRNKGGAERTRFDSVNEKPTTFSTEPTDVESNADANRITEPEKILLPPKEDYSTIVSTTMGPPIYYEWKWAVPAFDLEPPKVGNSTNATEPNRDRTQRNPFSAVTRTPTKDIEPEPHSKNTEYNISSYYVPDYVFPLDKPHPGYENAEAQTSFQVNVARPGRSSYGENPACPQCHPAYLEPGTCEPCIVKR